MFIVKCISLQMCVPFSLPLGKAVGGSLINQLLPRLLVLHNLHPLPSTSQGPSRLFHPCHAHPYSGLHLAADSREGDTDPGPAPHQPQEGGCCHNHLLLEGIKLIVYTRYMLQLARYKEYLTEFSCR